MITIQKTIAPAKQNRIDRAFVTLDGLRGVAAIAVVTRHVTYFPSPFFESYLAVDFFFVLSGFVLSHAYGNKLEGRTLSAFNFIKMRFIRLYPLYAAALVLSALLIAIGPRSDRYILAALPFAAIFLPTPASVGTVGLFPLVGPSWSLFFEIVANALWAFGLRYITGLRLAIGVGVAAAVMIVTVLTKTAGFGLARDTGILDNGYMWASIDAGFIRVSFSFFCGVLLHRLWITSHTQWHLPPLVPFAILILVLLFKPPSTYQPAYDIIATLLVLPLVVWIGAGATASGVMALSFSLLGVTSYGVYVLQDPVIRIFRQANHAVLPGTMHNVGAGVLCILFLIGVTLAADTFFDRPVRQWLTLRFRR